jgi:FdhD protein
MTDPIVHTPVGKVAGRLTLVRDDVLAVEAPLEIRLGGTSISVTMRTPGNDFELATGFLFAEGVIANAEQIRAISHSPDGKLNIVVVDLRETVTIQHATLQRGFVTTSACGLWGKSSLDALTTNRCPPLPPNDLRVTAAVLHGLPDCLRRRQQVFDSTGGLHAAALFDAQGELASLREDFGRHNAVDKLIGSALLRRTLPLQNSILLLSGRASYELVQKALMAGISLVAAVGAPSSLAVSTARRCGMTLIGFLRGGCFNVYSEPGRILGLEMLQ